MSATTTVQVVIPGYHSPSPEQQAAAEALGVHFAAGPGNLFIEGPFAAAVEVAGQFMSSEEEVQS